MTKQQESEALEYVTLPQFHQVFKCPRTALRVSFSEAGDTTNPDRPTILFCLPSTCSRYIGGPTCHRLALAFGVRCVAFDRPGCGGTGKCALKDRVNFSTAIACSLLQHLGIKKVTLLSHSAGVIYALDILRRQPDILHTNANLYLMSPWVPHSVSGLWSLPLIPKSLVATSHNFIPAIAPLMTSIGAGISFSSGLLNPTKAAQAKELFILPDPLAFRPATGEPYAPKPPYHANHQYTLSKPVNTLIHKFILDEPLQGMSQDYLLSLGHEGVFTAEWMETNIRESAERCATAGTKANIEIVWAAKDGMIPKAGQDWLDRKFRENSKGITFSSYTLDGGSHDDPVFEIEAIGAVLEQVRDRG